jgi:ABC-type branched-subunit amino acid transport system substrate-binding protein
MSGASNPGRGSGDLGQPTSLAPDGTAARPGSTVASGAPTTLQGTATGPDAKLGPTGANPQTRAATNVPTTSHVAGPIELGFMTTNVGNAQNAGINAGQTFSDKQLYNALIKEYNLSGGVAGRRIVPVYGDTDTAASNWNTQFQAACQKLTDDHKVKAVLGYVFVFLDSFEQCLAKRGVPHLYGGFGPGDVQAQRDFPDIVSVAHPTLDITHKTILAGALATGRLTKSSKLGILYDSCSHGDRAFTRSTEPFLKAHGISYESVSSTCSEGSADASAVVASAQSAQLQFASHGVDVVLIPNQITMLFFMQAAESQAYRPAYINQGGGGALEAQGGAVPRAQLRNLHGYGWAPAIDVSPSRQPYAATPPQRACLDKLKRNGLVPTQFADFMLAYVTCDSLDLYARALTVTGGDPDRLTIRSALARVLPELPGRATYGGRLTTSMLQRGGPARYRESGWDDGCSCITYRGPVRAVPTP